MAFALTPAPRQRYRAAILSLVDPDPRCYTAIVNQHVRLTAPQNRQDDGFTAAEFMRMVDSGLFGGLSVELVRGEIRKVMPAGLAHGEANFSIAVQLKAAFQDEPVRIAVDLAVASGDATVRAADIAVVRAAAPSSGPVAGDDAILLVEIATSTLARDLGDKQADYAAAGVPDYWVVDLNARVVHAMSEPEAGGYRRRGVIRFGEPLAVPGTGATITLE